MRRDLEEAEEFEQQKLALFKKFNDDKTERDFFEWSLKFNKDDFKLEEEKKVTAAELKNVHKICFCMSKAEIEQRQPIDD